MNPKTSSFASLKEIRHQSDAIRRRLDEMITRLGAVDGDLAAMKVDYAAA